MDDIKIEIDNLNTQLAHIERYLVKPFHDWTKAEIEQFGDKEQLREEKKQLEGRKSSCEGRKSSCERKRSWCWNNKLFY